MARKNNKLYYGISFIAVIVIAVAVNDYARPQELPTPRVLSEDEYLYETNLILKLYNKQYEEFDGIVTKLFNDKKLNTDGIDLVTVVSGFFSGHDSELQFCNEWIEKFPQSSMSYTFRAKHYLEKAWIIRGNAFYADVREGERTGFNENLKLSIDDANKAVMLNPENVLAMTIKYQASVPLFGESQETQEIFDSIIKKRPDFYLAYYVQIVFSSPKWGGNEKLLFERARKVSQMYAGTPIALMIAQAHSQVAEDLYVNDAESRYRYLSSPEVWKEIEAAYKDVLTHFPQGVLWMRQFSELAGKTGNFVLAKQYLDHAIATAPLDSANYQYRGKLHTQKQEWSLAKADYLKAVELAPWDFDSLKGAALAAVKEGSFAESVLLLEEVIKRNPSIRTIHGNHCYALFKLNRMNDALAACNKALEIDPYYVYGLDQRAKIHTAMGNNSEAEADTKAAQRLKAAGKN